MKGLSWRTELSYMKIENWENSSAIIDAFPKLKTLAITATDIKVLPFNPNSIPQLESLNLVGSSEYNLDREIHKIKQLHHLKYLCIAGLKTDHLPKQISSLDSMKELEFGYHKQNFNYEKAFELVYKLPSLEHLSFGAVTFDTLPGNFQKLNQLRKLSFYDCSFQFGDLFHEIKTWENFESLMLQNMDVDILPETLTKLKNLKTLKLHDNRNLNHQKLFRQLAEIPGLEELVISKTILHHQHDRFVMPKELGELKNLKRLDMATSQKLVFDSLFDVLANLPKLEKLDLYNCKTYLNKDWKFTTIPGYISEFKNLKELNIKRTFINILRNVEKLPPSLEKLNFSQVGFGRKGMFPPVILKTTSLKSLNLNDCELKKLPEEIGNLKNLVHLDLGNNQLKELPESITKLKKLRYLNLMGTYISESEEKRKEIEQMLPNALIFFGEYEAYEPI